MLIPSQPVPALDLATVDGGRFDLDADHGANGTLLIFYRGLHCPICIRQMGEVEAVLPKFAELGVEVAMISTDSQERARQTVEKAGTRDLRVGYGLDLGAARDDWGLYISSARDGSAEPAFFSEPGHFYIAADRTLYFGWLQSAPFARPQLSDIVGAIKFSQDKGYPPRGMYTGPLPGDD